MTARAELHGAVAAIRRGATDYLAKPLDPRRPRRRLEHALENASMRRKLAVLDEQQKERTAAVARSTAMQEVLALAARVAATPASSALLIGESGVGKEVVAALHSREERTTQGRLRPREPGGHPRDDGRGGALRKRARRVHRREARPRGTFRERRRGTILLDEVCEFKPELQPKLLRALEERRFFPWDPTANGG